LAAVYLRKAILTARAEGQQATPVAQKKGHQARINLVAQFVYDLLPHPSRNTAAAIQIKQQRSRL
jgi:hypothetical protein